MYSEFSCAYMFVYMYLCVHAYVTLCAHMYVCIHIHVCMYVQCTCNSINTQIHHLHYNINFQHRHLYYKILKAIRPSVVKDSGYDTLCYYKNKAKSRQWIELFHYTHLTKAYVYKMCADFEFLIVVL